MSAASSGVSGRLGFERELFTCPIRKVRLEIRVGARPRTQSCSKIASWVFVRPDHLPAIFYPFSQFCEIDICLPGLQTTAKCSPQSISEGGRIWQVRPRKRGASSRRSCSRPGGSRPSRLGALFLVWMSHSRLCFVFVVISLFAVLVVNSRFVNLLMENIMFVVHSLFLSTPCLFTRVLPAASLFVCLICFNGFSPET